MPRILDIGSFNAVRESGLAKLMPGMAMHGRFMQTQSNS